MIYIRPFKKEDLLAFNPIEPMAKAEIKDMEFAQAIEDSELAVTGIRDSKIVACGGVHPTNNSEYGELWIRLNHDCKNHKIETMQCLRDGLKIIEEISPFKYLGASIRNSFRKSAPFLESFGYVKIEEVDYENEKWLVYRKRIKQCQQQQ